VDVGAERMALTLLGEVSGVEGWRLLGAANRACLQQHHLRF
jgi:hypothetical protein